MEVGVREVWLDGSTESVRDLRRGLEGALAGGEAVLPLAGDAEAVRAVVRPGEPLEPRTAVVVATSGSTGAPKGVLLSAEALVASAEATHGRLGGAGHW